MELDRIYCPNIRCRDYRIKGFSNISVIDRYGKSRCRLLRCKTCGFRFSERRWTIFFRLHTDEGTIKEALVFLFEGKSIRKTAEEVGLDKDTVQRIWKRAVENWGLLLEEFFEDLNPKNIDLDNLVAFPRSNLWRAWLNKKRGTGSYWLRAKT